MLSISVWLSSCSTAAGSLFFHRISELRFVPLLFEMKSPKKAEDRWTGLEIATHNGKVYTKICKDDCAEHNVKKVEGV